MILTQRLMIAAAMLLSTMAAASAQTASMADANSGPIFDIPRMESIVIDGNAADWGDNGFRVDLLMPVEGDLRPAADHSARVRLAWCSKGLLMLAFVQDDQWVESPSLGSLWQGDALEVFMAPKKGHKDCCQWCISPGMGSQFPQPRWNFHEGRSKEMRDRPTDIVVARTKVGAGYVLEALLPFASLDIQGEMGQEIGFQVWCDDVDSGRPSYCAAWFPGLYTVGNHQNMHRLRLSDKAAQCVAARAVGGYDMDRLRVGVTVAALAEQAGKEVRILSQDKEVGNGKLAVDSSGRAVAKLRLPMPPPGKPYGKLTVQLDGKDTDTVLLPDADLKRAEAFLWATVQARPCVFGTPSLPPVSFEQPLYIEQLMGPFEIKTTYYDANYKAVTTAAAPGRYGAVAEIQFQDGRTFRRFCTLFRMDKDVVWWRKNVKMAVDWPSEMGLPACAAAKCERSINDSLKWAMVNDWERQGDGAILLSALCETKDSDPNETYYTEPTQRDRQWWVGLKRKLYGFDARYDKPFARPFKMDGPPAATVREGTLAEAGMKADAADKIDAVLTEWSKDTDEGFAVCIARHGVIVLHKAYGTRDGRPMTIADKSQMASATKCISGSMMLTLIDQGLLDLDHEAGEYLPPLKGLKGANGRALTVRHLYTHTSGIAGMAHWGDEMNDMEERMAMMVPTLKVGEAYAYNGAGLELACKILEAASGQSLPEFYRTRLLEPLGCVELFDAGRASYGTRAAPLAIAKILQMILNKGAYGPWRWFSEETYKQMLPIDLEAKTGVKGTYGMGTAWFNHDGLSPSCFGHGAASSATIRIDPANDLVIAMTRNSAGKNFDKYHGRFIRAVTDGVIGLAATQPATAPAK